MTTPTRQQIIEVALDILGEKAGSNITTREIAEKAGVNIASINYHFGTKDKLLDEAMAFLLERVYALIRVLGRREDPPDERLRYFCREFLLISGRYPGIIKNIVGALIFEEKTSPRIMALIPPLFNTLSDAIGTKHPDITHSKRVYRSGNLLMSLIFPQVFSHYYRQMVTGSLGEEFTIDEYLELILEQV